MDVYKIASAQNYIVNALNGDFRRACCSRTYVEARENNNVYRWLKQGAIRFGGSVGYGVELDFGDHCYLGAGAVLGYWSRLIRTKSNIYKVMPDGGILEFGLKLEAGYVF